MEKFCKEHLNDEYADLCRKLTEKLARKRETPLISRNRLLALCTPYCQHASQFMSMLCEGLDSSGRHNLPVGQIDPLFNSLLCLWDLMLPELLHRSGHDDE